MPAAVYACAVPVPYPAPPAVAVAVEFVPPLAIGKVPFTPTVKETVFFSHKLVALFQTIV